MTPIDLDAYCRHEIRRHQPPVDSPFLSGAIAGALIAFCIYALLKYVPAMCSFAGGMLGFLDSSWHLLFWMAVLGGSFGAVTLWLLSVTVSRLQVTLDAARSGFYAGGIAGAVFGAAIVIGRELSSSSTGILLNWNLYSTEITISSMAFAAIGAAMSSAAFALWCRPKKLAEPTPELIFVDDENRGIKAPRFDLLRRDHDRNKIRIQFGVKRLMALTALCGALIGFPSFIYRQLILLPKIEPYELAFVVILVAIPFFALPYGLWVVLRGPNVFKRLVSAIRAWKDLRLQNSKL